MIYYLHSIFIAFFLIYDKSYSQDPSCSSTYSICDSLMASGTYKNMEYSITITKDFYSEYKYRVLWDRNFQKKIGEGKIECIDSCKIELLGKSRIFSSKKVYIINYRNNQFLIDETDTNEFYVIIKENIDQQLDTGDFLKNQLIVNELLKQKYVFKKIK